MKKGIIRIISNDNPILNLCAVGISIKITINDTIPQKIETILLYSSHILLLNNPTFIHHHQ